MSVGIVHQLEAIHIQHQNRERPAIPLGARQFLLRQVEEMAPVIEAGQLIGVRLTPEFIFEVLALGDVTIHATIAEQFAIMSQNGTPLVSSTTM